MYVLGVGLLVVFNTPPPPTVPKYNKKHELLCETFISFQLIQGICKLKPRRKARLLTTLYMIKLVSSHERCTLFVSVNIITFKLDSYNLTVLKIG